MLNIAVCDDDTHFLTRLTEKITAYFIDDKAALKRPLCQKEIHLNRPQGPRCLS